jgi:tRNA pseudouridine13 synthase
MFAAAPRPSNYRSVLTYLVGHPQDYRAALNLIPQRTLSIYLGAYQSDLWNRVAGAWLEQTYASVSVEYAHIAIAGRTLPVHTTLSTALRDELAAARLPLPEHHATYQAGAPAQAVERVLADEGLALADLKARILKKAYLTRGSRAVLLTPEEMRVDAPAPDERYPGRLALRVAFALPPGSYATLVLEAASLPAQARV